MKIKSSLTFVHFEFPNLYLDIAGQKSSYFTKNDRFLPQLGKYRDLDSKYRNVKPRLDFH